MSKSSKLLIPIKFSLWNWESSLLVDCRCPPVVSMLCTTKSNRRKCSFIGFVLLRAKRSSGWSQSTHEAKCVGFFRFWKEVDYGKGIRKNTYQRTAGSLGNLHNPNNKAYRADADNRANQMSPNHRPHQRIHNANRRNKAYWVPDWAPDYPEYDD